MLVRNLGKINSKLEQIKQTHKVSLNDDICTVPEVLKSDEGALRYLREYTGESMAAKKFINEVLHQKSANKIQP